MSQYKAYPSYKDVGVDWNGRVPEHWEVKKLKHLVAKCQNGVWGEDPLEDGTDTLCIRVADFDRENISVNNVSSTYRQISKEHRDSRSVLKGDILLEKSGGGDKTLVGANVRYLGNEPAVCSNFVAVVRPSVDVKSGWLNYLMASMYALKINLRSIKQSTGIQNLDSEQYLNEWIATPQAKEQTTIATKVDRETVRIDTLIQKKKRFIELLKEKRQTLISHAVTKGLNPDVKMKDSGIEWIGEVPEHWQIAQLRRLVSINNGSDHKAIEAEEGFPVYGSGGAFAYATDYIYDGESVLLGRKGTIDKPLYVDEKFWTVDTMYWTKIMPNANGKFCYYVAKTIPFDYYASNTALPSMTQTDLGSHVVAFPDKAEQSLIASALDRETSRIDTLISKTLKSISLLKERRSAFITAAVTGMIDLRGEPA